jgi:hypothetical protein
MKYKHRPAVTKSKKKFLRDPSAVNKSFANLKIIDECINTC